MNEKDDPKHKPAAVKIAKAFKSRPLSWRLQEDNKTLVVVLSSGPKVQGTAEGVPDAALLAQLLPPKEKTIEEIEQANETTEREAALTEKERELAQREAALEAREKALAKKTKTTTGETSEAEGEINLNDGVSPEEATLAGKTLKKATAK